MNLFLKCFAEHFVEDLPFGTQERLADYSTNPKILRNLALVDSISVSLGLVQNPSTPSDVLETLVRKSKSYFISNNAINHPNVTERIRRLTKLNAVNRKEPEDFRLV